jgi:hypothetical protein
MVVGRLSFAILLRFAEQAIRKRAAEHLDPGAQPDQTQDANQLCELPPEALQRGVLAAVQREGAPFQTFVEYHGRYVTHADTPIHVESVADRT